MFTSPKRVVYQVGDVPRAMEWYTTFLEHEPLFQSPIAAIFRVGEGSLSLVRGPSSPAEDYGQLAVYWEVEDVDRAYQRLLDLGALPKTPPENVMNIRLAQAIDPFGIRVGLTGSIPGAALNTVEEHPSETAYNIALCRALAAHDPKHAAHYQDPFSELFLQEELRTRLADDDAHRAIIEQKVSPPLYGYIIARSLFFDELFRNALRAHLPQIVFLGVGYDTRALRFQTELGRTRIFELDVPATQQRKLQRLQDAATPLSEPVRCIPINFKTDSGMERLVEAGFDPGHPALFLWEGVTYYLSREHVEQTLETIGRHTVPGSGVAFDYMTERLDSINPGEPFLSWIAPPELPEILSRFGFRAVDHLDRDEMVTRYLLSSEGIPLEKVLSTFRLVYAEVTPPAGEGGR